MTLFSKKTPENKSFKIIVEKNGGVRIDDMDAFFAQEEVQRKIKIMNKMDLVGKRLNGNKIEPIPEREN